MRKNHTYFLIAVLLFISSVGFATETRVDSTGGLSLVLTDESQEINPFTLGNPAGIALLDTQNRFDAVGQWFMENNAATNASHQAYGCLSGLNTDPIASSTVNANLGGLDSAFEKYHGFIFFPDKKWAVQADGNVFRTEDQQDFIFKDQIQNRTQEFFQTAYNFGPFSLGGQVQAAQTNPTIAPGNYFGATLASGQGTSSGLNGQGGLLLSFPPDPSPSQDRFLVGGIYGRDISPTQQTNNLVFSINPGPTLVSLTETLTNSNVQSFGPDFYFQAPNSFEACLLGRFSNGSISNQYASGNTGLIPNQASYKIVDTNSAIVAGIFKAKSPLFKTTYLKSGLLFLYASNNQTYYNPDLSTSSIGTYQIWETQGGIGLEGLLDYTLGLQFEIGGVTGSSQPTGMAALPVNLFTVKVALGGEKWLSKLWAFRVGLTVEDDNNSGSQPYPLSFYTVGNGLSMISTSITTGLGYKDPGLQTDFLFFFGQPYVDNSLNPNDFLTQIGVQLAVSVFFL